MSEEREEVEKTRYARNKTPWDIIAVFRAPHEELYDFLGSRSKIHVLMDLKFVELGLV